LDVGCGKGEPMAFLNRHKRFKVIGIDIFEPYLEEAKRRKVYHALILGDVRHLPFKDRSFDVAMSLEVLEHLEEDDGERLVAELERVAREQILLTTPVGSYRQQPYDRNPYQEHKYIWSPRELKARGYKVRGVGLRGMGGEESWVSHLPPLLKPLSYLIYSFGTAFSYYSPGIACHMVAKKVMK
jgi:SAM-dependent methyltransferase